MDNSFKYSIDITQTVSQVPAIISGVANAVGQVTRSVDPLDKIIKILSRIEKILMTIGHVGVESFNKLDDILVTNREHFKKTTDKAAELEKKVEQIGTTSKKAGKSVKEGFLENFNKIGVAVQSVRNIASAARRGARPSDRRYCARSSPTSETSPPAIRAWAWQR